MGLVDLLRLRLHQHGDVQGLVPVVGIPLPFMSYGGTAMMSLLSPSAS